eukprot:1023089-Pleurochrysis_carterae.AAC.1
MGSFSNPSVLTNEFGEFDIDTITAEGRDVYDIFGQGTTCYGKKHGDGMMNVFDMALVLAYIFGRFPTLASDPSMVTTGLQGRTDVDMRCNTNERAYEYAAAFAIDNCIVTVPPTWGDGEANITETSNSTGRRRKQRQLQEPSDNATLEKLEVDVDTFAETSQGTWYRISIQKPYAAIDMKITRIAWPIGHARELELSNLPYPKNRRAPFVSEGIMQMQIRFAHPCEYAFSREEKSDQGISGAHVDANECVFADECAIIVPAAGRYILLGETFSFLQDTSDGRRTCALDFYLWIPGTGQDEKDKRGRRTQDETQVDDDEPCIELGFAPNAMCTGEECGCMLRSSPARAPPPLLSYGPPVIAPPVSLSPTPPIFPPPVAPPLSPPPVLPPSQPVTTSSQPPPSSPRNAHDGEQDEEGGKDKNIMTILLPSVTAAILVS